ncbi:YebG protein domain-containing protein [Desulfonema limicola]|uniref:YebG protein domain-containing protein n=1 Tax=Desulfonema limicola TaxID=45656 RepID=A0A975BBJ3_9BACT|nr:YebG family protein [Desulfonema limicola]QTA82311.1 YebG protein domain-containing protein [Desulfonema limicola]
MAVITKFFVLRNGVEIDRVFEDKKEAEAYDKMLDAAEKLSDFIKNSDIKADIDDKTIDRISVFLAQKGPEVIQILKGLKPVSSPSPKNKHKENPDQDKAEPDGEKKAANSSSRGKKK